MRKILIIANREYWAMVATKAFLITLVLMPVLMGGGIFVQERLRQRVNLDEKRMVVLDRDGRAVQALAEAAESRNRKAIFDPATGVQTKPRYRLEQGPDGPVTDQERLELSARVRRGEIYAFVEIPANVFAVSSSGGGPKATFYAQNTVVFRGKGLAPAGPQRRRPAASAPAGEDRPRGRRSRPALGCGRRIGAVCRIDQGGQPKPAAAKSETARPSFSPSES